MRSNPDCLSRLQAAGFDYEDACALRRVSMTLHRWHELECGNSNDYASWVITRGDWEKHDARRAPRQPDGSRWPKVFKHDEDGKPFLERHYYSQVAPAFATPAGDRTTYTPIPDRERGALKRLGKIMARYPGFAYYVQSDPRGCALYILRPEDLNGSPVGIDLSTFPTTMTREFSEWLSANYSRGIAVHK